ncbi:MAG TPA: response regulator [Pyrinomonadaceae bacterium]|nr:response regulator [Pyrinomonadaceae bacterium]
MSDAKPGEALPPSDKTERQRRALVVADSSSAESLKERLSTAGLEILCASAVDATRAVADFAPEVALVAFGEREGEGDLIAAARRLRTNPATYSLPVVFLFRKDERTLRGAALNLGADDYFARDTEGAEMRARLDALFWRAEAGRRAGPVVGDQRLEIDNFLLLLDAVRAEAQEGATGTVALVAPVEAVDGATDAERSAALAEAHGFFKLNLRRIDGVAFYGPAILLIYMPRKGARQAQAALAGLREEFLERQAGGDLAVGVAAFPSDGGEIEELIEKAETALGVAREAGAPSRVVHYRERQAPAASSGASASASEKSQAGASSRTTAATERRGPTDGHAEQSRREMKDTGAGGRASALPLRTSERAADIVSALPRSAAEAGLQERERRARGTAMPRRLLLAVSDAARMAQLNLLIRSAAYEVRAAFDGQQALSLLRIERPDLLLVDYELHDMDGVEMLKRLRKQSGGTLRLPTVLLLPKASEGARREALETGARAVVGLPYDPVELLDSIRTVGSDV